MRERIFNDKTGRIFIIGIFLLMVILTIAGACIHTGDVKFYFGEERSFSEGWVDDATGEQIRGDGREIRTGEIMEVSNTLPDDLDNAGAIGIYNNHFHITVMVEGEVIDESGEISETRFGQEYGRVWEVVRIGSQYSGKTIRLIIENQGHARSFDYASLIVGTSDMVFSHIIQKNMQAFVVSVIALIFGCLLISYYVFLRCSKSRIMVSPFLYLGMFSFDAAVWLFMDGDMMQFISANASLRYQISYFAFMLMAPLVLLFFKEYTAHYKKILDIWLEMYCAIAGVVLVLYVTNLCHISVSRIVIHISIVVSILLLCGVSVLEYVKYRSKDMIAPIGAFLMFAAAALYNILMFYKDEMYDNSRAFRVGFVLFIVALFWTTLRHSLGEQHRLIIEREVLQKAQAAQAKNDFLAKMSHDMRTPLNGIIGLSLLAEERQDNPPGTQQDIRQIHASANYLLSLINDILDMSKIESGKLELAAVAFRITEASELAVSLMDSQMKEKEISFTTKIDDRVSGTYIGDRLRVSQIIMNLLSNAVKFTPVKGRIQVSIQRVESTQDKDLVEISVSDSGAGMSEEFMSRIFQPFEQENEQIAESHGGTGLGLSIVHNLTELMHGTIQVQSQLGEGSTFCIRIPFTPAKEQSVSTESPAGDVADDALEGVRILLVEDHPLNTQIACRLLNKKGASVHTAEDGKKGVSKFEESEPGHFDLILMDIRMPVMDGYEAAQAIRNLKRTDAQTIPIIAMTANAYEDDVKKCLEAGMNAHISKPIKPEIMYQAILEELA